MRSNKVNVPISEHRERAWKGLTVQGLLEKHMQTHWHASYS